MSGIGQSVPFGSGSPPAQRPADAPTLARSGVCSFTWPSRGPVCGRATVWAPAPSLDSWGFPGLSVVRNSVLDIHSSFSSLLDENLGHDLLVLGVLTTIPMSSCFVLYILAAVMGT